MSFEHRRAIEPRVHHFILSFFFKFPKESHIYSVCYLFLAIVLDESDVESNCSADFSPKQTPINVLSKQRRSSRLLHHIDRINSQSRCELIHSTPIDPAINEIINLTTDLNFGYNQKAHLLRKCGQTDALPFDEVYSKK